MNTAKSQQPAGTTNSAHNSETQSVNTTNSQKPAIPAHRQNPLRGTAIAFLLALSAFLGLRGYQDSSSVDLPQAQAASVSIPAPALDTIPIEQIRVGQRVLTDGAPPDQTLPTAVDEHTWRHLTFEQTDTWPDGTIDRICVESLMPPDWLAFHDGAPVGSTVPIPLDLEEMGLPEGMTAQVTANTPCPAIDQGPGRVVLTTVNHLNPRVVELTLQVGTGRRTVPEPSVDCVSTHQSPQEDALAAQETIRPTAHHKFYSETRDQWLSAEDLQPGERLRGLTGPLQVVSQRPIPGTHRVYNMTVEAEHVYHVSTLGVLAHNNRCNFVPIEDLQASAARLKAPRGRMAELRAKYGTSSADRQALITQKTQGQAMRRVRAQQAQNGGSAYGHLTDHKSVAAGKKFTDTQRANLYKANREIHGGTLRSDLDGSMLTVERHGHGLPSLKGTRNVNTPAVDHVVPRQPLPGSGITPGSNSYSNAEVLSMRQNRAKSNN